MDIQDVELFLKIVETGSISNAADQLHFSQSTVSYRLKTLEKEIGAPLFYRNRGNKAELTLFGENFIDIAVRWKSVWRDTQMIRHLPTNSLTIATVSSIGASILPEIYKIIIAGQEPLQLNIMTRQSERIYQLVESQQADIGFICNRQDRKNIITEKIMEQKLYVIRFSRHPRPMSKLDPKELDPFQEIYAHWGTEYENWHEEIWGPLTKYRIRLDDIMTLPHFLTDENSWCIVPQSVLHELLRMFRTIQIDELDLQEEFHHKYYIITHKEPKATSVEGLRIFRNIADQYIKTINENLHR